MLAECFEMNWFIKKGLQSILAMLWKIKKNCLEFLLLPIQTLTFRTQYHDEGNLGLVIFLDKAHELNIQDGKFNVNPISKKKMGLMQFLYEAIQILSEKKCTKQVNELAVQIP